MLGSEVLEGCQVLWVESRHTRDKGVVMGLLAQAIILTLSFKLELKFIMGPQDIVCILGPRTRLHLGLETR